MEGFYLKTKTWNLATQIPAVHEEKLWSEEQLCH